jgi:hypothetical protein
MSIFNSRVALLALAIAASSSLFAQTSLIPPPSSKQVDRKWEVAKKDATFQGAVALPTEIIRGAGVLQPKLG